MAAKRKRTSSSRADASPQGGRRLSPEQRRAQILEVAAALFAERAYADITIGEIADAAGITEGLVYHYFESRTGVLAAALHAACVALLEACIPDGDLPVPARFEQGIHGYLDYVEAHRVSYINLFSGPAAQEPRFLEIIEQARGGIIEHVVLQLGLAEQDAPVTRLSMRGYLGYVEAVVLRWLQDPGVPRATVERLIFSVMLTTLSSGIRGEHRPPSTATELAAFEADFRAHFRM